MKTYPKSAYFLALLFSVLVACSVLCSKAEAAEPGIGIRFVELMKNPSFWKRSPFSNAPSSLSRDYRKAHIEAYAHSDLRTYYEKHFRLLEKEYPGSTFRFEFDAFQPYSGKANLGDPEVQNFPALLFVPDGLFTPGSLRYEKLSFPFEGKTIYGLLATADLMPGVKTALAQQKAFGPFFVPYVPDVNARVMGFSAAQVRMELSENLAVAEVFDYNGLKPWAQHNRYKKDDQAQKAIRLTNVAHLAGSSVNISDHPDFALKILDIRSRTRMTFFLWKEVPKGTSNELLPDFVFAFEVNPAQ